MGCLYEVRTAWRKEKIRVGVLPVNLCSRIMLMKSSNDARRVWLDSFANKKLGEDIEVKSWITFEQALGEMRSI